ncbi:hypothetical protein FHR81_002264 [Actinoalloteichus hoggarensis]|uniref:Uncharacterized protein n=1 Tax=Actinoalloteichus hoggarensis TaxID=1470176 RepID=A0A221W6D1_9PSEU|nr:hypothetical protein [Actinoalloteichus hoggarensis]ASO21294.1 hypothetical protein AHOG_18345 [Actinoalloteichus hoggarensis]MBB5921226.1 hypothetical protein [Actinoalloteichus hoggarensis]
MRRADPDPRHGPAAADAARWQTYRPCRTVLAVARTLTSAIRLLEATVVFLGDPRVQVVFTVHAGSRFSEGVAEMLGGLPVRLVPWEAVPDLRCDLVITASEKVDLEQVGDAPILVLPHGIGFHKYVPEVDSPTTRLSGLVAADLLARGRVTLAITHPDQARQLAAVSPATVGRTALIGDTSHDAVLGSITRRDRYRALLGASAERRLVVVSSTWGEQSLLGSRPEVLDRLLAELPVDEYRVAAVVHPNAWTWHGGWQLDQWLDSAMRAGLLLVPPARGWHAAVVAADVLIGDHGSVSLYAAALGTPTLLGAFGGEVVPGTPLAEFGRIADRLDPTSGLREQVDKTMAVHDPRRFRPLAEAAFAAPGRAVDLLRTLCHRLLALPEPATEPVQDGAPDRRRSGAPSTPSRWPPPSSHRPPWSCIGCPPPCALAGSSSRTAARGICWWTPRSPICGSSATPPS